MRDSETGQIKWIDTSSKETKLLSQKLYGK